MEIGYPLFPACAWIAENTVGLTIATEVAAAVATGANMPGSSVPSVMARTIAQEVNYVQVFSNFRQAKNVLRVPGQELHHVVEQCQASPARSGFSLNRLNSTDNLIWLDQATHQKISAAYSSTVPGLGMTLRNSMNGMSFEEQHRIGMVIIQKALTEVSR